MNKNKNCEIHFETDRLIFYGFRENIQTAKADASALIKTKLNTIFNRLEKSNSNNSQIKVCKF